MGLIQNKDLCFVTDLRERMQVNRFLFSYRGNFTQEITRSLLAMTERKLELEGTSEVLKKKVFNIMVECLQNIVRHQVDDGLFQSAVFMIGRQEDYFVVFSGNVISNERVEALKNKLLALNSMTAEDKKELFQTLIRSVEFNSKGGVGLGLIEIARKSNNKLEYDFVSLSESKSFFSLKTVIK